MPRGKTSSSQHIPNGLWQLQQSQRICDMAAALADNLTEIVLGVSIFGDELLIAKRLFESIEIGALNVLYDRNFQRGLVINIPDNNRDFNQTRQLGCPPTSFAGY